LAGPALLLVSHNPAVVLLESTYLRFVSIAEAFTDVMIELLFGRAVPAPSALVSALIDEKLDRAGRWDDRRELLLLHDIRLSDFVQWQQLDAGIEVRNTIAHGLGALTRRQVRDAKLPAKLQSIHVRLESRRVILSEGNISELRNVCVDYVRWLDQKSAL
jgi:hypothetical protein